MRVATFNHGKGIQSIAVPIALDRNSFLVSSAIERRLHDREIKINQQNMISIWNIFILVAVIILLVYSRTDRHLRIIGFRLMAPVRGGILRS